MVKLAVLCYQWEHITLNEPEIDPPISYNRLWEISSESQTDRLALTMLVFLESAGTHRSNALWDDTTGHCKCEIQSAN